MKGDKIIIETLPSSVRLFLQVNYIPITTTLTNIMILKQKQINIQDTVFISNFQFEINNGEK